MSEALKDWQRNEAGGLVFWAVQDIEVATGGDPVVAMRVLYATSPEHLAAIRAGKAQPAAAQFSLTDFMANKAGHLLAAAGAHVASAQSLTATKS